MKIGPSNAPASPQQAPQTPTAAPQQGQDQAVVRTGSQQVSAVPSPLPSPRLSPVTTPAPTEMPELQLDDAVANCLVAASDLLNNDQPEAALRLLLPLASTPEAQNNYAFQGRLGGAYLGAVDRLRDNNILGGLDVSNILGSLDVSTAAGIPHVTSQRISLHIGALQAYTRYLTLLRSPEVRQRFIEKNGAEQLAPVEEGVKAGLMHALMEVNLFITRVCQINSNAASAAFVERSVANGKLDPQSDIVKSFRQVQADPLYAAVIAACANTNSLLEAAGESVQTAWFNGSVHQREQFNASPTAQAAMAALS